MPSSTSEEKVCMEIPLGLETQATVNKLSKLKKSLYGLKQSPRAWFDRFTKVVKRYGYVQCQADHTLFVKHWPNGKVAILIVYVDDIVLTGDFEEEMSKLKDLSREIHPQIVLNNSVKRNIYTVQS